MGLKLVEVEPYIAENLPECNLGAQILQLLETSSTFRTSGMWGTLPREERKFVLRSLDDTPLLVAKKEERITGWDTKPGEQIAWGEHKKQEVFTPGAIAIKPLQFIAGSIVRLRLGNEAVQVTLMEDEEMQPLNDGPSSCEFEVGNPVVQFGLVPLDAIQGIQTLSFPE
jgi:hypothetical protein